MRQFTLVFTHQRMDHLHFPFQIWKRIQQAARHAQVLGVRRPRAANSRENSSENTICYKP